MQGAQIAAVVRKRWRWRRFRQGDEHDRLTLSIQTMQSDRVTHVRNPDWNSQGDLQFSPVTAMAAAMQCRKQVVGAPPVQMWCVPARELLL